MMLIVLQCKLVSVLFVEGYYLSQINKKYQITIKFGKKHGGGRDKKNRSARFLCIKDSNGVSIEQSGTTYAGTGTLHLKDIVVVGEAPSIETNSQTTYDGV